MTSGGVKARLEKGTITNKGKLQRKRKQNGPPSEERNAKKKLQADEYARDEAQKQREAESGDFLSQANLGDLDFDTFFASAADQIESKHDAPEETVDDEDDEVQMEGVIEDEDDEEEEVSEKAEDEVENKEKSEDEEESSNESDSDDDDVEAAEQRMMKEMEKLKSSDPDFHSFLKENEQSLLEFGDDDDDEEEDEDKDDQGDEDGEDDMDDGTNKETKQKKDSVPPEPHVHLTAKVLKSLELGAFQAHGVKSLRKLVSAYKSACHMSDSTSADQDDDGAKQRGKKYLIDSSEIFDKLMILCLNRCHEEFLYHLLDQEDDDDKEKEDKAESKEAEADDDDADEEADNENKPINPKKLEKAAKWEDLKSIMQSFFRSTFHVLTQGKEAELLTFVLKALSKYLRYLTPFPRLAQTCLKVLVSLWSAPLDQSEDYQVVRLNSFLRIRQMALTQPFPFIEDCLKKTYLAYAQRAKFGTASSVSTVLPTLTFMGNCVVELYSLDYYSSYQHAFVYIRQLALLLRTALLKKTPEAFQAVYCWQYVHSLKLWVAFLASTCQQNLKEDFSGREEEVKHLRSLIYPLTEVIFGTIRLVPTTRYLPLRFHCVRLLQQLASAAEVYIPTTSILLDVLDLKELYLKPKKASTRNVTKGMQLALSLKLAKDSPLRTSEELEGCVSELFVLLNREVDLYRYSAGFPEFTVRISQQFRKVRFPCVVDQIALQKTHRSISHSFPKRP